jgi:hypothetical protein
MSPTVVTPTYPGNMGILSAIPWYIYLAILAALLFGTLSAIVDKKRWALLVWPLAVILVVGGNALTYHGSATDDSAAWPTVKLLAEGFGFQSGQTYDLSNQLGNTMPESVSQTKQFALNSYDERTVSISYLGHVINMPTSKVFITYGGKSSITWHIGDYNYLGAPQTITTHVS